jgi:hypothetical protein
MERDLMDTTPSNHRVVMRAATRHEICLARGAMRASLFAFASASLLLVACSGSSSSDVLGPGTSSPSSSGGAGTGTSTTPTDPADPKDPSDPGDPPKDDPPTKPPVTTGPPATAADCDAFATKYCTKADACDALLTKILGTDCAERISNVCKGHIAAPGTGFTTTALTACGNAYSATATCDDAFGAAQITACSFKGTLANGAACAFGEQCTTGYCSGTEDNECGKCGPAPAMPPTTYVGLGETCDPNGSGPRCNSNLGLWCDYGTKKCEEMLFVGLGQPCGFVGDDVVMCGPGGTCNWGTSGSGTCVAQKAVGASCTAASNYPECAFGSACIGGTCAYPTAAAICK